MALTAVWRIVFVIVSPVVSAAATIVVARSRPATISAERARRRPALRTPSRKSTRLRSAKAITMASATPRATARTASNVPVGIPKTSVI